MDTATPAPETTEAKKPSGLSAALFVIVAVTLVLIAATVYVHEAVRIVEYVWSVT